MYYQSLTLLSFLYQDHIFRFIYLQNLFRAPIHPSPPMQKKRRKKKIA
jgi:hypothetical protein